MGVLIYGVSSAPEGRGIKPSARIKDGTLFMLYGRNNFEKMTGRKYEYVKGFNGHGEIALYVDTFDEVDEKYKELISKGATSVLEPTRAKCQSDG